MTLQFFDLEQMIAGGMIRLGRGNVISKKDIAACPGSYPIYSSARLNGGKFGEYGKYMFDEELITWSVDGGGNFFYRPRHCFSVTNVGGTLKVLKKDVIHCKYLYYILVAKHARLQFDWTLKAHPSVIRRLYKEIPLPPLGEQKRIAGILDAADALRAKRRDALAQLDTLLQATFLDMFGDSGEVMSIGELLSEGILLMHKDGNHGSLYPRAHEFGVEGIPFLSAKCISDHGELLATEVQRLHKDKARTLKIGWIEKGDVLMAHNASVGKTLLYRGEYDEAIIGTSLTAFRPNGDVLTSAYLLGALRSADFQNQLFSNMGQTTRNQVPITAQRRLRIVIPSLDLQHRFAAIVEEVEQQKNRMRAHLLELDTLFAALQSRAFAGEL